MKLAARKNALPISMREFDRTLPMMLYRALEAVLPAFRAIFAQFNLTETQWRVLRALWEQDGRMFNDLARVTLIPSPSLVGVVDRLTRDGFVTREPSDQDRRQVHIWLSPQGSALRECIEPLVREVYSELDTRLTSQQWRNLYEALDLLCLQSETNKKNKSEARRGLRRRGRHHVQLLPLVAPSQQAAEASVPHRPRAAVRSRS
jgi:homoprotocatechuate degradation regulator HpaR